MDKIKNIFNKITNTTSGKISLVLVAINLVLSIYDIIKISNYINIGIIAIVSFVLLIVLCLLILCATKYKKVSIVLNILLFLRFPTKSLCVVDDNLPALFAFVQLIP